MCENHLEKSIKSPNKKIKRDKPRFKVIDEYEREFKEDYKFLLKDMVYNLSKTLTKQIIKK
jgi:hypothetical protein